LRRKITRDGTIDKTIKERCTQGRKVISILNSVLCDQKTTKRELFPVTTKALHRPAKQNFLIDVLILITDFV
jgi:hypothetical protein